jgi:hypothetical protein
VSGGRLPDRTYHRHSRRAHPGWAGRRDAATFEDQGLSGLTQLGLLIGGATLGAVVGLLVLVLGTLPAAAAAAMVGAPLLVVITVAARRLTRVRLPRLVPARSPLGRVAITVGGLVLVVVAANVLLGADARGTPTRRIDTSPTTRPSSVPASVAPAPTGKADTTSVTPPGQQRSGASAPNATAAPTAAAATSAPASSGASRRTAAPSVTTVPAPATTAPSTPATASPHATPTSAPTSILPTLPPLPTLPLPRPL